MKYSMEILEDEIVNSQNWKGNVRKIGEKTINVRINLGGPTIDFLKCSGKRSQKKIYFSMKGTIAPVWKRPHNQL